MTAAVMHPSIGPAAARIPVSHSPSPVMNLPALPVSARGSRAATPAPMQTQTRAESVALEILQTAAASPQLTATSDDGVEPGEELPDLGALWREADASFLSPSSSPTDTSHFLHTVLAHPGVRDVPTIHACVLVELGLLILQHPSVELVNPGEPTGEDTWEWFFASREVAASTGQSRKDWQAQWATGHALLGLAWWALMHPLHPFPPSPPTSRFLLSHLPPTPHRAPPLPTPLLPAELLPPARAILAPHLTPQHPSHTLHAAHTLLALARLSPPPPPPDLDARVPHQYSYASSMNMLNYIWTGGGTTSGGGYGWGEGAYTAPRSFAMGIGPVLDSHIDGAEQEETACQRWSGWADDLFTAIERAAEPSSPLPTLISPRVLSACVGRGLAREVVGREFVGRVDATVRAEKERRGKQGRTRDGVVRLMSDEVGDGRQAGYDSIRHFSRAMALASPLSEPSSASSAASAADREYFSLSPPPLTNASASSSSSCQYFPSEEADYPDPRTTLPAIKRHLARAKNLLAELTRDDEERQRLEDEAKALEAEANTVERGGA